MKNKLLEELYDCFYIPPELPAPKQEIEECHQVLIELLSDWKAGTQAGASDHRRQGPHHGGHLHRQLHRWI